MRVENIITVKTFSKCFVFCSKLANSWIRFFLTFLPQDLSFKLYQFWKQRLKLFMQDALFYSAFP